MKFITYLMFFLAGWSSLSYASAFHDPRAIDANPATSLEPIAPRLEGLGVHSLKVTTSNSDSQYFFDQGLRLTYGFNHSEALRSFKEAVRLDPDNAMAYWGWALTLGPNINLPMQPDVAEQAFEAIQSAVLLKSKVTEVERAYIDALATRYAPVAPDNRRPLDEAYAEAMEALAAKYPDQLDAATLYGASLMNLTPWNYWEGDGQPKKITKKIMATFESVLERESHHPGAIHYYIHTVEVARPQQAEAPADILRHLMPGAGHMVHMPSHIYMRVGRYADAFQANREAADADSGYITQCNAQGIYPLTYYPHNLHFLVWAAMFQGRSVDALAGAREVQSKIPTGGADGFGSFETFLSQPMYVMVRFGLWDKALAEPKPPTQQLFMTGVWHEKLVWAAMFQGRSVDALAGAREVQSKIPTGGADGFGSFETFLSQPMYVMVRFGLWDKALAEPKPPTQQLFMTGVWHYMRGMAFSNTGKMNDAQIELEDLRDLRDKLPGTYAIGFQSAITLLTIAEQVLGGDMAAQGKDYDAAVSLLSRAVRLEDSLRYSEPPDWYFPTRHVLGAVLLQAGVPAEAATIYWQDLRNNPDNAYSLLGVSQALEAQGNEAGAKAMAARFDQAWAMADVELSSSRF